jgi:indole-3-glycerol phosphate synthase
MADILDAIVAAKRIEVRQAQSRRPLPDVQAAARDTAPPRDFQAVIASPPPAGWGVHVIAEIKKSSPSAGLIRADFDPVRIAETYAAAGASCLSVLTDERYFDGRLAYVGRVRSAVGLPVLRKDFVVDAYQLYEARAAGADAVLLIGEVLAPAQLREYLEIACGLGLTSLIEVHEAGTLEALREAVGFPNPWRSLLGINNRNLKIQKTDLSTTSRLARGLSEDVLLVSESGIRTRSDVDALTAAGARALLIGETFMRAPDIAAKVREVMGACDR